MKRYLLRMMYICVVLPALALAGCDLGGASPAGPGVPSPTLVRSANSTFSLSSPAFTAGAPIPSVYTCAGANHSPPLAWTEPPAGTQSLALVVDDPDAPSGTFVHWVLYNLPATARSLPENVSPGAAGPEGSRQGQNDFGKAGYGGPCPPGGTHHYFFRLSALDKALDLPADTSKAQLVQAMQGHRLAQAELMGTFSK